MLTKMGNKKILSVTFTLWYALEILQRTTLQHILGMSISLVNTVAAWMVWGLLMIRIICLQRYTWRELVLTVLFSVPIIVAAILSQNNVILSAWMFIVAARDMDFEDIIRTAYHTLIVLMPFVFLLFLFGIAPDYVIYRNGAIRHSFGTSHPNIFGMRIFQIVLCHLYIHRDELRLRDYVWSAALLLLVLFGANSRTAYIGIGITLVLTSLYQLSGRNGYKHMNSSSMIFIICYACMNLSSIIFSLLETEDFTGIERLDRFLSARFSLCHIVIEMFGVSVFGQRVYISETERAMVGISRILYLDNAYVSILVRYGIIVYLLFSALYLFAMIYFARRQKYYMVMILFVYALYGVMEPAFYSLTHNIFLLALSYALYGRDLPEARTERTERIRFVFFKNRMPISIQR